MTYACFRHEMFSATEIPQHNFFRNWCVTFNVFMDFDRSFSPEHPYIRGGFAQSPLINFMGSKDQGGTIRSYPLSAQSLWKYLGSCQVYLDMFLKDAMPIMDFFVTVGTAGEILHNFINQQPFVKTQFLRHGFLNLEVTNNGSNMTGTFYENNGLINEDQFTILKKLKIP